MASGGVMVAQGAHGNHFEPMDTSMILEKLGEGTKEGESLGAQLPKCADSRGVRGKRGRAGL